MRGFLVTSLLIVGCATSFDADDAVPPAGPFTPLFGPWPGEEDQGIYLLGKIAEPLVANGEMISASAPSGLTLTVSGYGIQLTRTSTGLPVSVIGRELPAPGGRKLRIDAVDPSNGLLVRYFDPVTAQWYDYCDASESAYAVAMPGYWTAGRLHEARRNTATFACQLQGKAAKCMAWGYEPETMPGSGPGDLGWDLHQACIQMAMALYCGPDDKPHTREKTPIYIRDFVPFAEPNEAPGYGAPALPLQLLPTSYPPVPPPTDVFYYESAFGPRAPAKCLNRERWSDQELGGPCPAVLPDPRVDPSGVYCEQGIDTDNRTLLVGSETMDSGLHTWSNGAGDTLTTIQGFVRSDKDAQHASIPPPGFVGPPLADSGYLIRNLTVEWYTEGIGVRVYRLHHANGDTVLGTEHMMDPYVSGYSPEANADSEGFVLSQEEPGTTPLYLYHNGNDYLTATAAAAAKLPTGFTQVQTTPIGWVISDPL